MFAGAMFAYFEYLRCVRGSSAVTGPGPSSDIAGGVSGDNDERSPSGRDVGVPAESCGRRKLVPYAVTCDEACSSDSDEGDVLPESMRKQERVEPESDWRKHSCASSAHPVPSVVPDTHLPPAGRDRSSSSASEPFSSSDYDPDDDDSDEGSSRTRAGVRARKTVVRTKRRAEQKNRDPVDTDASNDENEPPAKRSRDASGLSGIDLSDVETVAELRRGIGGGERGRGCVGVGDVADVFSTANVAVVDEHLKENTLWAAVSRVAVPAFAKIADPEVRDKEAVARDAVKVLRDVCSTFLREAKADPPVLDIDFGALDSVERFREALNRRNAPLVGQWRAIRDCEDVHFKGPDGAWLRTSYAPCSDAKFAAGNALLSENPRESVLDAVDKATVYVECMRSPVKCVHLERGLVVRRTALEPMLVAVEAFIRDGSDKIWCLHQKVRETLWPGDSALTLAIVPPRDPGVPNKLPDFHKLRIGAGLRLLKYLYDAVVFREKLAKPDFVAPAFNIRAHNTKFRSELRAEQKRELWHWASSRGVPRRWFMEKYRGVDVPARKPRRTVGLLGFENPFKDYFNESPSREEQKAARAQRLARRRELAGDQPGRQ